VFSEKDKCNFTHFSPEAKDVTVSAQGLRFKTSGDKTVVGWGNYDNRQAPAERALMYSGWNEIELKVKQSATSSVWKAELWANGKSGKAGRFTQDDLGWWAAPDAEATLKGTEPQVLRFKMYRTGADGFGLTLLGPADNAIEIQSIRVTQTRGQGCFRKFIGNGVGDDCRMATDQCQCRQRHPCIGSRHSFIGLVCFMWIFFITIIY